ncbi:TIM-barrel domain-containing protein [Saccharicrinis sp. FJH62]|uniref:TIM-barrel domain-containing protein n=1 Tax=Saccharicrinis sp. FJH62 TaxID=3344657 RepID=UPI0035D412FB
MKTLAFPVLLSFIVTFCAFAVEYDPVADPNAVVISGNARFTVLTPRVIRMEWAPGGSFTDNATLTFVNRRLPVPEFETKETDGQLVIRTGVLTLTYKTGSGRFTKENLNVEFSPYGNKGTWCPGKANPGNLLGTTRTLDNVDGAPESLEQGIISRDGWVMVDDSDRPLFDNSDWPWVMARREIGQQDYYLFVYGTDYKTALKDFTAIAGKIALPPKFAFGAWWSRYRQYTDTQFRDLIDEFEMHDVPLDVLVIDIDWHYRSLPQFFKNGQLQRDQAGETFGWTGYTWDTDYFPDPKKFLQWTNEKDLKTCLNLHPASGIQPFEAKYPEMAKAMGIDPKTKKYVPFDITDKKFASNYMDIILHPFEKDGVDFWWLDWQQWGNTNIPGVNPTFYLNYVHYSDMERQGKARPLIFHRWGGLGNHRYQIGFSGDTHITWKSLQYQPYFTATAANVGFGYWSHDIGGHMGKPGSPELYTRWIQWGIFSPIFRTHCTSDTALERRIWAYPLDYFKIMRDAYQLRYTMIPYIYNEAYYTYESGVSTVHPMYYDYPGDEEAYQFTHQYMFGRDMLVAPVTKPLGKDSLYTMQKVWLPKGSWFEMSKGSLFNGDQIIDFPCTIEDIPVFIKEGAIIPMQTKMKRVKNGTTDPLILSVYPGSSGSLRLYEDEGNNNNFKNSAFSVTPVTFIKDTNKLRLTISPVEGSFPGMFSKRAYELRFPNTFPPLSVLVNGTAMKYSKEQQFGSWFYNGNTFDLVVYVPEQSVNKRVNVEIEFSDNDPAMLSEMRGRLKYMRNFEDFRVTHGWDRGKFQSGDITALSQFGQFIEYYPEKLNAEIHRFNSRWNNALKVIQEVAMNQPEYLPQYDLLKLSGNIAECPEIQTRKVNNGSEERVLVDIKSTPNAHIFYTLDGTEPTDKSKLFTTPLNLKLPMTIQAVAYPGGNGACSAVVSKSEFHQNTGLRYKLYRGSWSELPEFKRIEPVDSGSCVTISLSKIPTPGTDYGLFFEGFLDIPATGTYTFYLASDDGSRFYIDNTVVVDHDGLHGLTEKEGALKLKKGKHPLKIEFFQKGGGADLSVQMESSKIQRTDIVPYFVTKND